MRRGLVHLVVLVALGATLVVWRATGGEGYTRWPNERLSIADAPPPAGERELLADAGFSDSGDATSHPDIRSRFSLGLAPGGTDPKHLISVATIAGACVAASVATWVLGRRARVRSIPRSTPVNPGEHS